MSSYHNEIKMKTTFELREMLKELPTFVTGYFRSITDQTEPLTRLGYARDLRIFFGYLYEEVRGFDDKPIKNYTETDIARVTKEDILGFMEYVSYYIRRENPDIPLQNEARGKSRKLAAVRTLFRYLYSGEKIPANPAELVHFPKLTAKTITTLEVDEIARLLDEVDSGEKLTPHQQRFHEHTKIRDAAMITLLLGTGMRVSEMVGLDLHHIDFEICGLKVTRKGGDEMILYFGDEVESALKVYLAKREEIIPIPGHEDAVFLSLQNRRISVRAVQNLVKKYASVVTHLKNISPHKLRSTFGTQLYQESGDIYLVAEVLGHADVNTTRKHYAKMDDTRRRQAARAVRLRD